MAVEIDPGTGSFGQQLTHDTEGSDIVVVSPSAVFLFIAARNATTLNVNSFVRGAESTTEEDGQAHDNYWVELNYIVGPSTVDNGITPTLEGGGQCSVSGMVLSGVNQADPWTTWVYDDDPGSSALDITPTSGGARSLALVAYGDENPTFTPDANITKYGEVNYPGGGTEVKLFCLLKDGPGAIGGDFSSSNHSWAVWATELKAAPIGNRSFLIL